MKLKKLLSFALAGMMSLSIGALSASAAEEPVLAAPEGDILEFVVDIKKAEDSNLSYLFYKLKKSDYVIQAGDVVEYDFIIHDDMVGIGHIDIDITTAGMARDVGMSDNMGNGFHTGQDLTGYGINVWAHRSAVLALTADDVTDENKVTVGQTIKEFQLATHPADNELAYTEKQIKIEYDNIVITNNGEVKYVVFQSASDVDPTYFKKNHSKESEGVINIITMSADESAKIKADQIKAIEDASKAEEERIKKASEEKASREASEAASKAEAESIAAAEASEAASIQAASIEAAEEEEAAAQRTNMIIIIAVIGVVVIGGVIAVVAVMNSKKKKK